jgi:hypothetical protein
MPSVLSTYEKWKAFLGEHVHHARQSGMSDETIQKLAFEIGEFLMKKVDPQNNEERVLKELWVVCDETEKRVLAKLMIKLVD